MKYTIPFLLAASFLVPAMQPSPAHAADTLRQVVGPGITYTHVISRSPRLHTVALKIDISRPENYITTVVANDNFGAGNELVRNMSRRYHKEGHLVMGALNGDYWNTSPPQGQFAYRLANGQISGNKYAFGGTRNRSSFGITTDGKPFVDIIKFSGSIRLSNDDTYPVQGMNSLQSGNGLILYNNYTGSSTRSDNNSTEWRLKPLEEVTTNVPILFEVTAVQRHQGNMSIPSGHFVLTGTGPVSDELYGKLADGEQIHISMRADPTLNQALGSKEIAELIGGGPRLVENGELAASNFVGFEGFGQQHSGDRHPRTAIGFNRDSTIVIFAVVDGRQFYSQGASMQELATIMQGLGAWTAVNLDGGGSSTLVVRDEYKNNHDRSFGLGTFRPVVNGLIAVTNLTYSEIAEILEISPVEATLDTAETITFSATVTDHWEYELPVHMSDISWEVSGLDGEIDANGTFSALDYGEGYVIARYGELTDSARVMVMDPVGIEPEDPSVPERFTLNQNYPNPFNPDTRISYEIPEASHVRITVFDLLGRPVAVITDDMHQPGKHAVRFDASGLSSGIYIYEIIAGNFMSRKKMTLLK